MNFDYLNTIGYHTAYHLYDDKEKLMLTDLLEIHFVEIPKFLEQSPELNNNLNLWLTFLTRPEKEVLEVAEPAIKKAITVLDTLSRDPETVRLAELRMKKILDEKSLIEGARDEARAEGLKLGKEEGLKEGSINIARSLLTLGLSEEDIIKATGLTKTELNKLKEK